MVANCDRTCPLSRRMMALATALAIGFSLSAAAQTAPASKISADAQSYSSSTVYSASLNSDALLGAAPAEPVASASPQYGGHTNYPSYNNYSSTWSHIAFDAGAGFTAPIGNDTTFSQAALNAGYLSPSEGWGYNINFGGGWNFSKKFGVLLEYQFNRENMDNGYLNAFNAANPSVSSSGGLGGNINTWSLTLDPVYYLPYSQGSGFFVTAGGGFYRKVTNFTEPVCGEEYFYYYCENATAYHFSSNQGGFNAGLGWYHKVFGPDSNGKFYAEVRYVWVDSPTAETSNYYQGEGTEGLIPVTFGVRF
jgi:hypothetical protein